MDSTLSRLLLDYEEAGDALNVGRTTIYKLVAAGEITPVKIGSAASSRPTRCGVRGPSRIRGHPGCRRLRRQTDNRPAGGPGGS
jgi:excisionase family DNA binding protein